jgi:hypothetical protein
LELAQRRDCLEDALVIACSAGIAGACFAGHSRRQGSIRLVQVRKAIRRSLIAQRNRMIALRTWGDARCDELDVMEVYDVEVPRVQSLERATHAATDRVARVVKVRAGWSVAPDFGQELVGAAREFVRERLQGLTEDDLGIVVVGRGVKGADAVSVCVCVYCVFVCANVWGIL